MTILHIVIFVLISAITNVTSQSAPGAQLKCKGRDEVYYSCAKSCGDGCDVYRLNKICTTECQPGKCQCRHPSYYRHPNTTMCVYKDLCPTVTEYDYNKGVWLGTSQSTSGSQTTPKPQTAPEPQLKCRGANETYYACSSACGDGCDLYRTNDRVCTADCKPGACACTRPNYFRDPLSGKCVYKDRCPTTSEYDYVNGVSKRCKDPNELFTECGPSCDRDGCSVPRYFAPCTQKCVPGCFCRCGYNRLNNTCVEISRCPKNSDNVFKYSKVCPKPGTSTDRPPPRCAGVNEEYTYCGSTCGDGCRNIRISGLVCTAGCKEGCACKKDHLRDPRTGQCVPQNTCPTTAEWDYKNNRPVCTKPNQWYNSCGSGCGDDCKVFRVPPAFCPAVCKVGCTCKPNFYKHPLTGECIPQDACPTTSEWDYVNNQPRCKSKEIYTSCGSGCGDGCNVYRNPPQICPAVCKVGCVCEKYHYRHPETGVCIPEKQCYTNDIWDYENNRPRCNKPNEAYTDCGSGCGDGCGAYINAAVILCPAVCEVGCRCKQGYHRHPETHVCVPQSQCPSKCDWDYDNNRPVQHVCGNNNEEFLENGPSCGDGCVNFVLPPGKCNNIKPVRGCFCKKGYHRDPRTKLCVASSFCPSTAIWDYHNNKPIGGQSCVFPERKKWLNKCWESCNRGAPTTCNQQLILSCFCTEGYCRNKQNQCVRPHAPQFHSLDIALSELFETKQRLLKNLFGKSPHH